MPPSKLKPMVRAQRVQPLRSTTRHAISRAFEEALFRHADVLSEGLVHERPAQAGPSARSYTGSTMLTVALSRLGPMASEELRCFDSPVFLSVLEGSVRVRLRAMRLAMAEASRRCVGSALGTAQVETRIRLDGDLLHIDVDVEAPVQQIASRGRGN